MSSQPANSCSANELPRCQHRFANGKRCRTLLPDVDAAFCKLHAQLPENQCEDPAVPAALTAGLDDFKSADSINEFLSRLLRLLANNKISPRRAAVLAYITNQILRTVAAIDREAEAQAQSDRKRPTQYIWDLPAPARERIGLDAEASAGNGAEGKASV